MPDAHLALMNQESDEQLYEISAVSRLTGVSTPNIRVWEKRYAVVEPRRSPSHRRRYTSDDIQRLTLLKALVDRGDPIGTIAALSTEGLASRLEKARHQDEAVPSPTPSPCRLVVIGETLTALLANSPGEVSGIELVKTYANLDDADASLGPDEIDTLLVECPTLFADMVPNIQALIQRAGAFRAILVYRFAQRSTIQLIHKGIKDITAIRGPIDSSELNLILAADVAISHRSLSAPQLQGLPPRNTEIPERLFSDQQLAVASQISTAIDCECPQHLGSLLTSLTAFEAYCATCESRNPADAALHQSLLSSTANARALMEQALQAVVELEGITL